ncbi:sensor histidine kinase [Streptomyces sp. CBMA152]|uniref:sensor histidine kinase n=1 Tax=Streptomyces sp. CBMA152 TaxID=1896312 RepID=UPI001660C66F|nr:sensor histidine kinase [Streptomyces sp. CBMA152]MBD0742414.1 histidine kinase [Streptomyces sp. CBMA152]
MSTRSRLRQALFDSALAVGVAVSGCVAGTHYPPGDWATFGVGAYLLTCLTALPLALRRAYPMASLTGCCLGYSLYLTAGYQPSLNWWAVIIALVSLAAGRELRASAAGALVAAVTIVQSGFAGHLGPLLALTQALLVPVVCLLFGQGQRKLSLRNAELKRLTEALAHEQREKARRAVLDERIRIARELHDVVAHHMSVISVQAGLAEYVFTSDPLTARSALSTIGGASREALQDLRRLLTVLRVDMEAHDDSAAPLGPLPELSRVGELAQRLEAAGLAVEIQTTGVPRRLDPGLEVCAYRVLQEALTNVVKHAESAQVSVHIAYQEDQLSILVRDDGGTGKPAIASPGRGHGLIGMRERVRICGGRLSTGPLSEGGFEVHLSLPTSSAPLEDA